MMTLDLIYVALLGIVWPLYEYFVDWPRFLRQLRENPESARVSEYFRAICQQWLLVIVGVILWTRGGRPLSALGLNMPEGWRLWSSVFLIVLLVATQARSVAAAARSAKTRAFLRKRAVAAQIEKIVPHTTQEFRWFLAVSLTAGICEEFLFRGYFISVLAPQLSWWGAAALSVLIFGILHSYQGRKGIVRTAIVGAVLTLIVADTRSLIPAMILHALVDLGSGLLMWLALRETPPPEGEAIEATA